MSWVGRLRARRLSPELRALGALYAREETRAEREAIQLAALNREWERVARDVPFYAAARSRLDLPPRFGSLDEFFDRIPPTTREALQRHRDEMVSRARPAEWTRMTGGSTAQPVQLAAWRSERGPSTLDMWLARSWHGVRPDSRLFQIWGHSHLLGTGLAGRVNAIRRRVADRLLGYLRVSAYDMRPAALRRAGDALLVFRPEYVTGYSVALHRLALANADRAERFRAAGLRVVIATAEAFPDDEARAEVARLFGCPVAMEYGAVETGVIAQEHPDGDYRVLWRSHLLEAERTVDGRHAVRVTSLHPRCFPLLRYEIGDEIELSDPTRSHEYAVTRFRRVAGRCNDYLEIEGALIHSEAFAHAVRPCAAVRGFQVIQGSRGPRLRYTANDELDEEAARAIRARLGRIHPALASMALERVADLARTVAGKTRMVVVERD